MITACLYLDHHHKAHAPLFIRDAPNAVSMTTLPITPGRRGDSVEIRDLFADLIDGSFYLPLRRGSHMVLLLQIVALAHRESGAILRCRERLPVLTPVLYSGSVSSAATLSC